MRAFLEDGSIVELGHKYVRVEGESGDDPTLLRLDHVAAVATDCRLEAIGCWLTGGGNFIESAKGEAA